MLKPPPKLEDLKAGNRLVAGMGYATILPDIDFETYSEAGFVWNATKQKWDGLPGANKKGLPCVGSAVYTEHPTAEVLCCAYDLKNGNGKRMWQPGDPLPQDLFDHIASGGLIEAWHSSFEYWVWTNICVPKYGWPPLPQNQLRCAMSKSRAFAMPGHLDDAAKVMKTANQKDKIGKKLINIFCIPRAPTIKNPSLRIFPAQDPNNFELFRGYNVQDIATEGELSSRLPDLMPDELDIWLIDQRINYRGVQLDREKIRKCISIVKQAHKKYNAELQRLTNGFVPSATQVPKLKDWLYLTGGIHAESLDEEHILEILKTPKLPYSVQRALEIRLLISSAAVRKLYAMTNSMTRAGRIHNIFAYHSARTGRFAGSGIQPQNFPNSGLEVYRCYNAPCGKYYLTEDEECPWCGTENQNESKPEEWSAAAAENVLEIIDTESLACLEYYFAEAIGAISGCLRGLIIAAPNHNLICSDYSAIEAVVLAALAGEQWRLEVFRTHGKIYEMSASKISGVPFEEFAAHKERTGSHHPLRKTIGKVAELASGFGGWIGAWLNFGADKYFSEDEMKKHILAWRKASPAIVEFWGGQQKNWKKNYYGLEGACVSAIENPGKEYTYRGIVYIVKNDILFCRLLSGRYLTYHKPRLEPSTRRQGTHSITFEGWNTNADKGKKGWTKIYTYSGQLCENVVQATARDILTYALVNLEKAGYPVVLHVHDEIVAEIPEGFGSIQEFEKIMSTLPAWAKDWPIKASGGWIGKRYTK